MSSLNVLKPTAITADAQVISISTTESADGTYNAGTTYALAATVKYNHVRYESLQASNTGHTPDEVASTWWLELGPTNNWAMFDAQTSTSTTGTGEIVVRVKPGAAFNSVAVIGITGAASVTCEVFAGSGGSAIYTRTESLDNTFISSWYEYFFEPYDVFTDLLFGSLNGPGAAYAWGAYLNGEVKITITGTTIGTTVTCAGILIGTNVELGSVQYGASSGINDYSVKETDAYGITTLVQRAYAKRANYSLVISNSQLRRVHSTLAALRATPAVWVASTDYNLSPLTVFGFYKDFSIQVAYPNYSTATLEIEGLT